MLNEPVEFAYSRAKNPTAQCNISDYQWQMSQNQGVHYTQTEDVDKCMAIAIVMTRAGPAGQNPNNNIYHPQIKNDGQCQ